MTGYSYDMFYPSGSSDYVAPAARIISGASNLKAGANPAFVYADFVGFYPQFSTMPDPVLDTFLEMANAKIQEVRWHSQWKFAMCLYLAHLSTLYLAATMGTSTEDTVTYASPVMLTASESAGDVSGSYDVNVVAQDLVGYGDLKTTTYGQQLASMARIIGKGGMAIW
jgi:hypothetical protein